MKTVLVTGGVSRLGLAIAARLRADGWRVVASSHRPDSGADVVADLSEPLGAAKLYAAACAFLVVLPHLMWAFTGGLAMMEEYVEGRMAFNPDDSWFHRHIAAVLEAVNLEAPKKLTTLMACREEGRGSVVNILDCRVLGEAASGEGAYSRTKRELLDYTRKAAAMFADTLRVNAVAPGPVMPPVGASEKAGDTPLGRPTPEDVAEAVAFLLGAERTSGCVVPVDGGQSL